MINFVSEGSDVVLETLSRLETAARHIFQCLGLGSVSRVNSRLGLVSKVDCLGLSRSLARLVFIVISNFAYLAYNQIMYSAAYSILYKLQNSSISIV